MVTDSRRAKTDAVKGQRKGLSRRVRTILTIVAALVVLAGVIIGSILYVQYMDRARIDSARQEAQAVVQDPLDEWILGGDSYVEYREADARRDQQASRRVYVDSNETNKAMKSSMCYDLFNAAMKASVTADVQYAADCIERNGAGLEVLSGMSKTYELAGDTANAQKYKKKIENLAATHDATTEGSQEEGEE